MRAKRLLARIDAVDAHLNAAVASLPAVVRATQSAVRASRVKSNRKNLGVGAAVAVGRVLKQMGRNLRLRSNTGITYGDMFMEAGGSFASGAFASSRFLNYMDPDPECGVRDAQKVLDKHGLLLDMRTLYRPYLEEGAPLPTEIHPEALEYHAAYLGTDLRGALSCLLGDGQATARPLNLAINSLVSDLSRRLALTASLMDVLAGTRQDKDDDFGNMLI